MAMAQSNVHVLCCNPDMQRPKVLVWPFEVSFERRDVHGELGRADHPLLEVKLRVLARRDTYEIWAVDHSNDDDPDEVVLGTALSISWAGNDAFNVPSVSFEPDGTSSSLSFPMSAPNESEHQSECSMMIAGALVTRGSIDWIKVKAPEAHVWRQVQWEASFDARCESWVEVRALSAFNMKGVLKLVYDPDRHQHVLTIHSLLPTLDFIIPGVVACADLFVDLSGSVSITKNQRGSHVYELYINLECLAPDSVASSSFDPKWDEVEEGRRVIYSGCFLMNVEGSAARIIQAAWRRCFRVKSWAASRIQIAWKECRDNPAYKYCSKRLLREFSEMRELGS